MTTTPLPSDIAHEDTQAPLSSLTEFPGNPRRHGDAQINELKRSLEMFGQFRPMVVDEDDVILAGNGMFQAMTELGWETGKVTRITGMSEAAKKKLVLADNRIAGMGFTNYDDVDRILAEINDTSIPGYDDDFLAQMLADAEEVLDLAGSYGTFEPEELSRERAAEGTYTGDAIPQHQEPRHFEAIDVSDVEGPAAPSNIGEVAAPSENAHTAAAVAELRRVVTDAEQDGETRVTLKTETAAQLLTALASRGW